MTRLASSAEYSAVVIGGGFFGLYMAAHLRRHCERVLLCEKEADFMRRASYVNQARVHNGYHYPRSILTALRSRVNFPRFVEEFSETIDRSFEKLYAVARTFSKVSAAQFRLFMTRIGAPVGRPSAESLGLFDPRYIEDAFLAVEHAFDALVLTRIMVARIGRAGVDARLETRARSVRRAANGDNEVELESPEGSTTVRAHHVFNCTYSEINEINARSGLPIIPLKHELTEMCLVEVPRELAHRGITVMCGPFFSCMPFPPLSLHTLSHVRYTPHFEWYEDHEHYANVNEIFNQTSKKTAFPHMIRDVRRYVPSMASCKYRGSLWEVKTILPRSEIDDGRPILIRPHHGIRNYHVMMGGKIDNIYDAVDRIDQLFL
jgi:glycine/D-amino acid oxidase-like deaminating enzyme